MEVSKTTKVLYRPEIDSLRAIAVIGVIIYHAYPKALSGGFLGVDVFFVISGFLISQIIFQDYEKYGRLSLSGFYERRIRRLLPALTVVLLASSVLAYFLMFDSEYIMYFSSLSRSGLFVSNIFFANMDDYFAPDSSLNPLLHLWSLSVEEQFYIFFPIIVWIIWSLKAQKIFPLVITLFILLSFVSAILQNGEIQGSDAFYLIQFRAWELLIGVLAAYFVKNNGALIRIKWLTTIGFLGIALAFFFMRSGFQHPGFGTVLPIVFTFAVLINEPTARLEAKWTSNRLLVGTGLVSYSAYLWHQPLFSFLKSAMPLAPEPKHYLMVIAVTFVLAYVTWKFVERPFRNKKWLTKKQVLFTGALILALIIASGVALRAPFIMENRRSLDGQSLSQVSKRLEYNFGLLPGDSCSAVSGINLDCMTSKTPDLLLWGDSLAQHLVPGMVSSQPEISMVQATKSACGPIIGYAFQSSMFRSDFAVDCIKHNDNVLDYLRDNNSIRYVVLASNWQISLNPESTISDRNGNIELAKDRTLDSLKSLLSELKKLGKKLVIVLAPPTSEKIDSGQCAVRSILNREDSRQCDFMLDPSSLKSVTERIRLAAEFQVPVFSFKDLICPTKVCVVAPAGINLYRDTLHLSISGSKYLGIKFNLTHKLKELADDF